MFHLEKLLHKKFFSSFQKWKLPEIYAEKKIEGFDLV